jgi:hypothetical protein
MLSRYLILCLIDLFSAASRHYGLEAKVFSRLIVNIQLWFGGGASNFFSVPLLMEVFSFLSCVTKHHPNRMSDSVDVKDMIQFINGLTTLDEVRNTIYFAANVISRLPLKNLIWLSFLTNNFVGRALPIRRRYLVGRLIHRTLLLILLIEPFV